MARPRTWSSPSARSIARRSGSPRRSDAITAPFSSAAARHSRTAPPSTGCGATSTKVPHAVRDQPLDGRPRTAPARARCATSSRRSSSVPRDRLAGDGRDHGCAPSARGAARPAPRGAARAMRVHLRAVVRHVHREPRGRASARTARRAAIASSAARSPDSVTDAGPFTAASDTRSSSPRSTTVASLLGSSPTASIPPLPAARCWRRPRWHDHAQRLLDRQRLRDERGGDLAGAVADHGVRHDAPRAATAPRSAGLDGEVRGVRDAGPRPTRAPPRPRRAPPPATSPRMSRTSASHSIDHVAEHRLLRHELAPHAPPLRAHAREDEGEPRAAARSARARDAGPARPRPRRRPEAAAATSSPERRRPPADGGGAIAAAPAVCARSASAGASAPARRSAQASAAALSAAARAPTGRPGARPRRSSRARRPRVPAAPRGRRARWRRRSRTS